MAVLVTTVRHDDVMVLEIDNPPVNALSVGVMHDLVDAVDRAERTAGVEAVVVRGAGRLFMGGADLSAIRDATEGNDAAIPDAHHVLHRIEHAAKPVVMAIHGSALGGGLELAMAGHFRVATEDALVGQPEVNLGLIPGFEGTARLPRLAGLATALDLCVSGRTISAREALDHDVISAVTDGELTGAAITLARVAASRGVAPRTSERAGALGDRASHTRLLAEARRLAASTRPFETAPVRVIDAIEASVTLSFDEACRRERALFVECLADRQSRALVHLFFAERAVAKSNRPLGPIVERLRAALASARQTLRQSGISDQTLDAAWLTCGRAREGQTGSASLPDVAEQLITAVSEEATRALQSDPQLGPADVDVVTVRDLGFPRWTGGVLHRSDYMRSRA